MSDILFYVLSVLMVSFAIVVVTSKNILHAAIFLVATFFSTAILYLVLQAEFVAIAQVLVYIGGIIIFVVFTILLTSRLGEDELKSSPQRILAALMIATTLAVAFIRLLYHNFDALNRAKTVGEIANLDQIGVRLLTASNTGFLIPFEVVSVLLLVAMVGAIVIARRFKSPGEKSK